MNASERPDAVARPSDVPYPRLDEIFADLAPQLGPWMREQRWFSSSSADEAQLHLLGSAPLGPTTDGDGAGPMVVDAVVRTGDASRQADYQVPMVLTWADPSQGAPGGSDDPRALIAEIEVEVPPVVGEQMDSAPHTLTLRIEDATRSDAGRRALLGVVTGSETAVGEGVSLDRRPRAGSGAPGGANSGGDDVSVTSSRLLSGEQSNSSMIFEADGSAPIIAKIFRVLQEGENPDVVLQGALSAAGSEQVSPMFGAASITWGPDAARGHALFVQEFLTGVEDAWRVALRDAVEGIDFTQGARELGEATARVHRDLAQAMPTARADAAARERMITEMLSRLDEARAEVSEVDAAADALAAVLHRAQDAQWPDLQRIHGDYHLGQVLSVPGRGWVLLDFEGEPMRPLAERVLPDSPVRDVAGMLRSLDYVAGAVRLDHGADAEDWARAAREAFLEGYGAVEGAAEVDPALLAAFEADKAVYEALYEARNRPDWLPIPLAALARIAG